MRGGLKGGQLKILTNDQIYDIHLAVLKVLEQHGIKIEHEGALKLLKDAGADVDFKTKIAKIPQYLVEESIKKAPKTIRLYGRNPKYDFVLEGLRTYFGTGSGQTYVLDLETGERRRCTFKDMEELTRLGDALENIDFAMGSGTASDAPSGLMGLYEEKAVLLNTEKHFVMYSYHGAELTKLQIKIAELVAGGEEELRRKPIVTLYDEPQSPLIFGRDYIEALFEWVKKGLPIVWAPCTQSGATAPVTLAGSVVQTSAESLGGNVIIQLLNPGTPFIYGGVPLVLDMKYAVTSYTTASTLLMAVMLAQMSHYYDIPLWGTTGCTDSKLTDAQAAAEAALYIAAAALSGQNLIHDIGYMDSGLLCSADFIVICDELIGMIKRLLQGVEVNEETLAVEAIKEAGHAGSYLSLKHTRKLFKQEHYLTDLLSKSSWRKWISEGGKDLTKKAREKARKILKEHEVTPLPKDVVDEIDKVIKSAAKEVVH